VTFVNQETSRRSAPRGWEKDLRSKRTGLEYGKTPGCCWASTSWVLAGVAVRKPSAQQAMMSLSPANTWVAHRGISRSAPPRTAFCGKLETRLEFRLARPGHWLGRTSCRNPSRQFSVSASGVGALGFINHCRPCFRTLVGRRDPQTARNGTAGTDCL